MPPLVHYLQLSALLALFLPFVRAQSPTLVVHPVPESLRSTESYAVKVRNPGGEWKELPCYAVEVDMHKPRRSTLACFDFSGEVEVAVTHLRGDFRTARIRPLSFGIAHQVNGRTLSFSLKEPHNLSIEFDDDIFDNLHLFANAPETNIPNPKDPMVLYFGPGIHESGRRVRVASGQSVYLAGGAVLKATLVCDKVEKVRIYGRGALWQARDGISITYSKDVAIDGIMVLNPSHYSVQCGQSSGITIRNLKSFSSRGWSDGIDLFCCTDVLIEGVFMRNSDDCIAIYGHRWGFFGDTRAITVRDSILWADVAHPINIGTHGNSQKSELIEDLRFSNIDILNQDEPQINYQGCIAINASDENRVRRVTADNIRVEDIEQGQLINLRVTYNRKYAQAPGRSIEDLRFRNLSYNGTRANLSIIAGYDDTRGIRNVVFEDLSINGRLITKADQARIYIGDHVEGLEFRSSGAPSGQK